MAFYVPDWVNYFFFGSNIFKYEFLTHFGNTYTFFYSTYIGKTNTAIYNGNGMLCINGSKKITRMAKNLIHIALYNNGVLLQAQIIINISHFSLQVFIGGKALSLRPNIFLWFYYAARHTIYNSYLYVTPVCYITYTYTLYILIIYSPTYIYFYFFKDIIKLYRYITIRKFLANR